MNTWDRYGAYLRIPPELSLAWNDVETGARGWLVINSLRGGAAGGGTRMRKGLNEAEVIYLSKAMELKFALAGPPIGGAKSGIDFDPGSALKTDVLDRWYTAIEPMLRMRYGTAGDLNVDELLDVVPAVRRRGLRHPQEGVVRGHLTSSGEALDPIITRLDEGAVAPLNGRYGVRDMALGVADMITGYGVAESVIHYYRRRGQSLQGVRVLLEGFGNVGAAAAVYLAREGARIVGITDARQALVDPDGVDAAGVEALMRASHGRLLPADDARVRPGIEAREAFWQTPAEVFICAAVSESVTPETLDRLDAAGVRVLSCGANHPFREARMGETRVQQQADARFAVIADVLANCGRARAFGYLMEPGAEATSASIFEAVADTIRAGVDETLERGDDGETGLMAATTDLLLDRIGAP